MSWRRRHRVRPSWAISSSPAGTPRRIESITAGQGSFAAAPIRVSVGGDDLLIDHVGDLDRDVLVGVKHAGQPMVLAHRQQLDSGAGNAPDPIQRVAGMAAASEGLVLDTLADQVELGPGQCDHVEGIMPTSA
jgi:hypothetical protein